MFGTESRLSRRKAGVLAAGAASALDEQSNAAQAKALHDAGCCRIFEKAASGARCDRPELHHMLDQLRDGDVVVVWKLDRLSRSLKDVLHKRGAVGSPSELGRTLDDCGATFCGSNREPNKMVSASIMIWSVLRSPSSFSSLECSRRPERSQLPRR